ncbi:hypothetical protein HK104_009624 [Borealophlyctis nickersoniae]|nr:hypothetical protein HK104_009624 [Borealophlyctis nickersoniae]
MMEVATAVRELSKPSKRSKDIVRHLENHANWEQYLTPAPTCIALLGQIQLVACASDFSLEESTPRDGFKYIRHPKSFRACLVQVSNMGWVAFNTAHTNMDQISVIAARFPGLIKEAYRSLIQLPTDEMTMVLPTILADMDASAADCLSLATDAETKFMDVVNITSELLEVSMTQDGVEKDKLLKNQRALLVAKKMKEAHIMNMKAEEENLAATKKQQKKAEELYESAMKDKPDGWSMVGMDLVEGLGRTVLGMVDRQMSQPPASSASSAPEAKSPPPAGPTAFEYIDQVKVSVQRLAEAGASGDKVVDALSVTKAMISDLKDTSPGKKEVLTGCMEAIELAQQLSKNTKQLSSEPGAADRITQKAKLLLERVNGMSLTAQLQRQSPIAPTITPKDYAEMATGSMSASGRQMDAWKHATRTSQADLEATRQRLEASHKRMSELREKQADLLSEMQNLNLSKLNIEDILDVLRRGMQAIGEFKQEWSKMVHFFNMLSNIAKSASSQVGSLTNRSRALGDHRADTKRQISHAAANNIFELCVRANGVANLLEVVSSTYVDVSSRHLVGAMAQLSAIAGLDVKHDQHKIQQLQQKLTTDCAAAQKSIETLVLKRKREMDRDLQQRSDEISGALAGLLPAAAEESGRVAETVRLALKNETQTIRDEQKRAEQELEDYLS